MGAYLPFKLKGANLVSAVCALRKIHELAKWKRDWALLLFTLAASAANQTMAAQLERRQFNYGCPNSLGRQPNLTSRGEFIGRKVAPSAGYPLLHHRCEQTRALIAARDKVEQGSWWLHNGGPKRTGRWWRNQTINNSVNIIIVIGSPQACCLPRLYAGHSFASSPPRPTFAGSSLGPLNQR